MAVSSSQAAATVRARVAASATQRMNKLNSTVRRMPEDTRAADLNGSDWMSLARAKSTASKDSSSIRKPARKLPISQTSTLTSFFKPQPLPATSSTLVPKKRKTTALNTVATAQPTKLTSNGKAPSKHITAVTSGAMVTSSTLNDDIIDLEPDDNGPVSVTHISAVPNLSPRSVPQHVDLVPAATNHETAVLALKRPGSTQTDVSGASDLREAKRQCIGSAFATLDISELARMEGEGNLDLSQLDAAARIDIIVKVAMLMIK